MHRCTATALKIVDLYKTVFFKDHCYRDVILMVLVVVADTEAEDLIRQCLSVDQSHRPSLSEILNHPWMKRSRTVVIADEDDDAVETSTSS